MFEFLEQYEELTISEQKVLKYILKHIDEIPHLQINELASNSFVSKTVVINLAQKLGFDGFKELKYHINSQLLQNKGDWKPKQNSIKDQLTEDITKTLSLIKERDIDSCGKILLQSRNIFIMARGTSKSVGYYLEHLLFSLGLHCFFIDDYNLSESFTRLVGKEDVVILISLSGSTPKIIETAKLVHLKDAYILTLTSFHSNQLNLFADKQLYCYAETEDTKKDDSISRIGFFILVDLLISSLKLQLRIEEGDD